MDARNVLIEQISVVVHACTCTNATSCVALARPVSFLSSASHWWDSLKPGDRASPGHALPHPALRLKCSAAQLLAFKPQAGDLSSQHQQEREVHHAFNGTTPSIRTHASAHSKAN